MPAGSGMQQMQREASRLDPPRSARRGKRKPQFAMTGGGVRATGCRETYRRIEDDVGKAVNDHVRPIGQLRDGHVRANGKSPFD